MKKKQKKALIIAGSLLILIGMIIGVLYATGVLNVVIGRNQIESVSMSLVEDTPYYTSYQLSFSFTDPITDNSCDMYNNPTFYRQIDGPLSSMATLPELKDDLQLDVYFPATKVNLEPVSAITNLCAGSRPYGIPVTYSDSNTQCRVKNYGVYNEQNRAIIDCIFNVTFYNEIAGQIQGVKTGYAIVKIPKNVAPAPIVEQIINEEPVLELIDENNQIIQETPESQKAQITEPTTQPSNPTSQTTEIPGEPTDYKSSLLDEETLGLKNLHWIIIIISAIILFIIFAIVLIKLSK